MPAWMNRAACRGLTGLFFPDRGDHETAREARAVCDSCPVWRECLDYAVSSDAPEHGILAGLGPRDRVELRRDMRTITPSPTPARSRSSGQFPSASHLPDVVFTTWTRVELLEYRAVENL